MMTDPKKRTDRTTRKATAGRGRKGRLDVPSVRIRRRRIDAGTTSRPYGVSPSPQGVRMHPTLAAGLARGGWGVDYWQSMSKGGVENGVPMGRRGDRMAHRIRIHDNQGGSRHGKGMRRPLRTAIAVIVATAMLTPTIASAAPVVPDAPSPVPGVESSSPYADDGGTYTADGRPLYESTSDTIYIYNALQTAVSRQEDAADQPVLTGDGDAETFGTGQSIYAEGSDEPLTYSPEHTYVYVGGTGNTSASDSGDAEPSGEQNSADKNDQSEKNERVEKNDEADRNVDQETEQDEKDTEETTAAEDAAAIEGAEVLSDGEDDGTGKVLLADEAAVGQLDGRDYVGQTVKEINRTKYILIGNEQQLRAIGTGKHVVDKVWYRATSFNDWEPKYVGDADIAPDQTLADTTYTFHEPLLNYGYYGSNESGEVDVENDASPNTGLTYSADANYIIFRDIDLSQRVAGEPDDGLWTPLTFSGTMTGAKAGDGGNIWDDAATAIQATGKPTIAHVTVNHADTKLDTSAYTGIGFFSTLTNRTDNVSMNTGRASVSNLRFQDISVKSNASEVKQDVSLINDLLKVLTGLLGSILGPILGLLGNHLDLKGLLTSLLTLQNDDPSTFATGSFAGRVVGDVVINDIEVDDATVANAASGMTGGFIGYSNGITQYEGLSDVLGGLADLVSNLLNIIPGLGIGDLITILLRNNVIDVGRLIPVGYVSPTINRVTVNNLNSDGSPIGNEKGDYAGGFAGQLTATVVSGATVTSDGILNIQAKNYAGGFVGLARNGEIQGTLDTSKLAQLELWDNTPQTLVHGSGVSADGALNVTAGERYAGGFAGGLAAAHMVDDGVNAPIDGTSAPGTGSVTVKATKSHAGGFAGIATLGWETDLGKGDPSGDPSGDHSLLATADKLLYGILTGTTEGNAEPLLALVGIKESTIFGAQVSGDSVTVSTDGDHAAGLLGEGRGTVIASVSDAKDSGETYWDTEVPKQLRTRLGNLGVTTPQSRGNAVTGLASVSAGGSYAGGIAGSMQVASGGGLLNNTLGLVNVMSPVADSVTVNGAIDDKGTRTMQVSADSDYAAGGVGAAVGMVSNAVTINDLSSVSANNYAGGFMGTSSAGDLVSAGSGLNLLGLNLVSIKGLLSVGSAVQTTVNGINVNGVADSGMRVVATAAENNYAGGFVALGSAVKVTASHVKNLATVTASDTGGRAGGFTGTSTASGLADVGDEESIGSLLNVTDLLGAITYLLPSFEDVDVSFVGDATVKADYAGGFAGEFEAGTVDNAGRENREDWYAVYGIDAVEGQSYAGGFGGRVVSGALANAGGGISILGDVSGLTIDLAGLLDVIRAYVPTIMSAGVKSSERGLVVSSAAARHDDSTSGSAGGYIGYVSGVQISDSSVSTLRHTTVTPPGDLEAVEATSYFDTGQSAYAVSAPRYAGGYIGEMNIGSAASVGKGIGILGSTISLTDLLSALQVVASTVEHSNVYGSAGGYAVRASSTDGDEARGHAGGFAGRIVGGQVQDSNSYNFSYIIGEEAAGGYAGELAPGDVADVAGDGGVLEGLVDVDGLASLAQAFIPTVRNSETTSVPCGGAVRAQAASDAGHLRGMAGGYVGHNLGGQIWGNNNAPWKNESEDGEKTSPYNGPQREAAAIRIRSVYGAEYAGGFTGLMEPGSTAETGGLSLLWGLISADNLLNVMEDIYPTEENTAVYGPLRGLTPEAWNTWVDAVGVENVYGALLGDADGDGDHDEKDDATATLPGHVESQEQIDALLDQIAYGTNVVAGRAAYEAGAYTGSAGVAGGYVGSMVAGTITNGQAHDTKLVRAMRAAGGFVGAAETGGVAELGDVGILGISLELGKLLPSLVSVFVPVIKCSSVTGYRQGMTVESFGSAPADREGQHETDTKKGTGFAGGYIGYGSGAQIWGDANTTRDGNADSVNNIGCTVSGLRRVSATAYAGGFAGKLRAASVASADTNASDGFLQGLLNTVISGTGITNLAEVLNATMSTVRNAHVSAAATDEQGVVTAGDASWGFTVDAYTTGSGESAQKVYPIAAGGFAGAIEATVLGELTTKDDSADVGDTTKDDSADVGGDDLNLSVNPDKGVSVSGLRGVDGGNFAGGLVGLADVAGAADVASGDTEGAGASVLKLIGLGGVSVLQKFQPCIYGATVDGVADGLTVRAHEADTGGLLTAERRSGNAGGFIGSIMSGVVRESSLTNLSTVSGPSYTGGFIGYTGKSGVLDVEDASLERLIGLDASAVNTFSTLVQNSTVAGIPAGYTVASTGSDVSKGEDAWQISGGFVGYADLAHITGCRATALKRVGSGEVAGGFAGKGTHAYLVSADADSPIVAALLTVVSALVKALWLEDLQNADFIDVHLTDWVLHLEVMKDGNTLKASLLGIPIEVTLNDENAADNFAVAHVKIGSSTIDLNVSKDNQDNVTIDKEDASNIAVNLIKANMTVIEGSSVTGIADGYDVFAGGSTQTTAAMDSDSSDKESGFAGGFIGWSDEAQLKNNEMLYADVVRGTAGLVAPFAGRTDYDAAHKLDTVDKQITGNTYHVYRGTELANQMLSGAITSKLEGTASATITGTLDDGDPTVEGTPTTADDAAWARFDIKGHKVVEDASNHDDWKDVKAGDTPIDVWQDAGATAVLMANAAVNDNTGALTPEPEEGQDPCAATADLTITKVWDDHGDTAHRPDSITVELWQSYTNASGKTESKKYDGMLPDNGGSDGSGITSGDITLSAAEASPWSNTWQHVVKMLPVAWNDNGTIRYFSYSVKEVKLNGGKDIADYSTTVTPGEDGTFHIVITNRLPLPETGGMGAHWFAILGVLIVGVGILLTRKDTYGRGTGRHRAAR